MSHDAPRDVDLAGRAAFGYDVQRSVPQALTKSSSVASSENYQRRFSARVARTHSLPTRLKRSTALFDRGWESAVLQCVICNSETNWWHSHGKHCRQLTVMGSSESPHRWKISDRNSVTTGEGMCDPARTSGKFECSST